MGALGASNEGPSWLGDQGGLPGGDECKVQRPLGQWVWRDLRGFPGHSRRTLRGPQTPRGVRDSLFLKYWILVTALLR